MKRRITALFLCIALLISALPGVTYAEGENIPDIRGAAGEDFTSNSYIAGQLQTLFDNLPYSDYPYFTTYGNRSCGNNWCSSCMGANVAKQHPNLKKLGVVDAHTCWSCFAFARYAFLFIFGIPADGLNYYGNVESTDNIIRVGRVARSGIGNVEGSYDKYTLANLQSLFAKATTGDIIQGNGATGSGNHTMLFLKCDSEGVYVLQNNMYKATVNPDTGDEYGYNRVLISKLTYSTIMNNWGNIVSILRAKEPYYTNTWSKSSSGGCTTHTYTAEGGDRCTVCGAKYNSVMATSDAGLYTVSASSAVIHASPYAPSASVATENGGNYISVIGSLVNSIGEKWYQMSSGNYVLASSLKKATVAAHGSPVINITAAPAGSLKKGASFNIIGKVTGECDLKTVRGCLVNKTGLLQKAQSNPEAPTLELYSSAINYNLKFGSLADGDYLFFLAATDTAGRVSVYQSAFNVSANGGGYTPSTPEAPRLSGKTAKSVTLVASSGMEYRVGANGPWQRSNLFSDLQPNTTYTFYQRVIATSSTYASAPSPALTVTTDKYKETNTPLPILAERTATTVRLQANEGYEYSMDGVKWQSSPLFKNLEPMTSYLFYQRMAASEATYVGEASEALTVTTDKPTPEAPDAPNLINFTDTTLELEYSELLEYTVDGEHWQSDPHFASLVPGTVYACRARLKETDVAYAGHPSEVTYVTTDRSYPAQPDKPTLARKEGGDVWLTEVRGMEYSLNGMNWQSSAHFTGLLVDRSYTFYQRVAETDRNYISETSTGLQVDIIPGSLESGFITVDNTTHMVSDIRSGTALRAVIASMKESNYIRAYDAEGNQLNGKCTAATGMELSICDGDRKEVSYTLLVRGDIDGNGASDLTDIACLASALTKAEAGGSVGLTGIAFLAADMDGDGVLTRMDLAYLRRLVLENA